MNQGRRVALYALSATVFVLAAAQRAQANWLSHIIREAGEAGGKAAGHAGGGASHLGPVGKAAAHLKGLNSAPKGALAAHATPEGHWQFVNRDGQTFTVGTPDELQRVLPALTPDAVTAGETKLSLYLSEDSVFENRDALGGLPKDADLNVVTDAGAFNLTRTGSGLRAQLKPNLSTDLIDRDLFEETLSRLSRLLNTSNIRVIALEPGASNLLSSAPRLDPVTKLAAVDQLDPVHLARAFRAIRGQTAVVTGRVDGGKLYFTPAKGPEMSRDLVELVGAAAQNDVDLIILKSDTGMQAGGRNWLWQKIEVGGLSDAAKKATAGDFLDALAAKRGGFNLATSREASGRIQVSALPYGSGESLTTNASDLMHDAAGHFTGEVVTKAVKIHSRDDASQKEQDGRFVPGIPTYIQIPYLTSLIAGLLGWSTSRRWWQRLWQVPERTSIQSRASHLLKRALRETGFFIGFLPVAGIPALLWQAAVQTWASITAPFRWFRRRFLRTQV